MSQKFETEKLKFFIFLNLKFFIFEIWNVSAGQRRASQSTPG
jgi:hypothetical protein